jgi:hypothetical protein
MRLFSIGSRIRLKNSISFRETGFCRRIIYVSTNSLPSVLLFKKSIRDPESHVQYIVSEDRDKVIQAFVTTGIVYCCGIVTIEKRVLLEQTQYSNKFQSSFFASLTSLFRRAVVDIRVVVDHWRPPISTFPIGYKCSITQFKSCSARKRSCWHFRSSFSK